MNNVFKVVWNTETQTWIVVSEVIETKTKQRSTTHYLPAVNAITLGITGSVIASTPTVSQPAATFPEALYVKTNDHNILVGRTAGADPVQAPSTGVISIGFGSFATGTHTIAIGNNVQAATSESIAIGNNATATVSQSTAIGTGARATNLLSAAVGSFATNSGENSGVFGIKSNNKANKGFVVGYESNIGENAESSIVLGSNNNVTGARSGAVGSNNTISGSGSFVIGNNVTLATNNSVVLGDSSTQAGSHAIKTVNNATVVGVTYSGFFGAAKDEGRIVSVGAKGDERKIINVAAGDISHNSTEAINGSQLYLTHAAIGTVNSNIPFNYTSDEKPVVLLGDKFYKPDDIKDLNYNPAKNEFTDKKGDIVTPTAIDENTVNVAVKGTPKFIHNIASNLTPVEKSVLISPTGVPVQNFGQQSPDLSDALKDPNSPSQNNAATISDVLNAGWNLQGNGIAKDFVRHTDSINFADGVGTTVVVDTDPNKKVSTIKINTALQYTDKDGNPLQKLGDAYYPADAVVAKNGNVYPAGTKFAADGDTPLDPNVSVIPSVKPQLSLVNVDGTSKTPTVLGNVAAGAEVFKSVDALLNATPVALANDGKWYFASDVKENGQPFENAKSVVIPKGNAGLIDFTNSNPNNALTVADARNLGWILTASDNDYSDQVRNANKVEFKGKGLAKVTGETSEDGVRTITVDVVLGEVSNKSDGKGDGLVTGKQVADAIQNSGFVIGKQTEAITGDDYNNKDERVSPNDELRFADGHNTKVKLATKEKVDASGNKVTTTTVKVDVISPVVYTDKDGNKVTPLEIKNPATGDTVGTLYYPVDENGQPDLSGRAIKPEDVITSVVNPNGDTTAPTTLTNIKSNLKPADKVVKSPDGKVLQNPFTDGTKAPELSDELKDPLSSAQNNAATISDVLNSGWDLQANGKAKDFVRHTDKVNFVDGKNSKVTIDTSEDGKTSTIRIDLDYTNTIFGEKGEPGKDGKPGKDGVDGKIGVNGKDGSAVVINGKDGSIGLNGKDGANAITIKPEKGADGVDGLNGEDGKTRIIYETADGKKEQVATLNDGLKFKGNNDKVNKQKLNTQVNVVGERDDNKKAYEAAESAKNNIMVESDGNSTLTVKLAKDLTNLNSVTTENEKGKTVVSGEGVSIAPAVVENQPVDPNKVVSLTQNGLNNGGNKIVNVANGRVAPDSKDAVNGSQLHQVTQNINNKIGDVNSRVNKLDKRMRGIGANAAAASSLPQVMKPGKSMFSAAAGGYNGASAVAVGYSRASDNGKVILKLTGTANSAGQYSGGVGIGYQW